VHVWDAATGAVVYTYSGYNVQAAQLNPTKGVLPDLIFAVAWSRNGKRIAAVTQVYCGDLCAVVLSWDAYTGRNFSSYLDVPILALSWSPDDTRFVTSIVISTQGLPQRRAAGRFICADIAGVKPLSCVGYYGHRLEVNGQGLPPENCERI
jgi:hypothetical protein